VTRGAVCNAARFAAFHAAVMLQPAQPITPVDRRVRTAKPHGRKRLPPSAHRATIVTLRQRSVILLQPNAT
jgi:hypothetical protein